MTGIYLRFSGMESKRQIAAVFSGESSGDFLGGSSHGVSRFKVKVTLGGLPFGHIPSGLGRRPALKGSG